MKDEKLFVVDTLKNVYGLTNVAEDEYISDEDPNQVDDDKVKALFSKYDKEKIGKVKTKSFDEGAKAREKTVKSTIETSLKTKFGITDFEADDIDTLIDHAVSLKPKASGAVLTPEEIEKLPHVIGIKSNFTKQLKEKETEFNEKLTAKEQEEAQKQLFGRIAGDAIAKLNEKSPVLPTDQAKADRRIKKDLIEELNAYRWIEQDNERIPLGKDGKQLENSNGVPITEVDLVESIINDNFEFTKATPRTSSGGGKPPVGGKPDASTKEAYSGKLPANNDEYVAMINDRKKYSVEERLSIQRQYNKKKGL